MGNRTHNLGMHPDQMSQPHPFGVQDDAPNNRATGRATASILLLAVVHCILFLIIWLITERRHYFQFFPNLSVDVGFIDSLGPLYMHEHKGPRADLKEAEKSETEKQQKSDSEKKEDRDRRVGTGNHKQKAQEDSARREDDRFQQGSGNGNAFEMVTKEELEQQTDGDCEEEEEGDNDGETTESSREKS